MYENNPKISLNNYIDNQIIWRYMDFTKFLSLLQFSSLFFCTCSQMQNMDPFEGNYPGKNIEKLTTSKEIIKIPSKYYQKPRSYRTKFFTKCRNKFVGTQITQKMLQCGKYTYLQKKELQ